MRFVSTLLSLVVALAFARGQEPVEAVVDPARPESDAVVLTRLAWEALARGRHDEARDLGQEASLAWSRRDDGGGVGFLDAQRCLTLAHVARGRLDDAAPVVLALADHASRSMLAASREGRALVARYGPYVDLVLGLAPDLPRAPEWDWDATAFTLTETLRRLARDDARLLRPHPEVELQRADLERSRRAVDHTAIARELVPGEVAVGYVRWTRAAHAFGEGQRGAGRAEYLAWVLRADGVLTRVDLGSSAEIERLIRVWRAAIGAPLVGPAAEPDPRRGHGLGCRLRGMILDPVLAAAGRVTKLRVVPDGLLAAVPLDSLPSGIGDGGDRWAVVRTGSFGARRTAPLRGPNALLTIGVELATIVAEPAEAAHDVGPAAVFRAVFGAAADVRAAVGVDASPAALRALTRDSRFIHVGAYAADPRDVLDPAGAPSAGLRLGPSAWVTVAEVAALDLTACELALLTVAPVPDPDREGGALVDAFLAAGARAVVTSLWEVDAPVAEAFVREWYRCLWERGEPRGSALLAAKTALRERRTAEGAPRFRTRDWAGWVLVEAPE